MMLRSPIVCAGLSLAILASAYVVGCSDDEEEIVDQTGIQPPTKPEAGVPGDGDGAVFAINRLFLGDTDRNGQNSLTAWKQFGYNIDHLISDATSDNLCAPVGEGTPASVYPDGNQGIDNSFGRNILPIITSLASNASEEVNDALAEGAFSIIIRVDDLGSGANYVDLPAFLYAGAAMEDVPLWNGTDVWDVMPELLDNPSDINSSKVQFPDSFTTSDTWVSGSQGTISISLSLMGYSFALSINKAVITMDLDAARAGATNGTIAGLVNTSDLVAEIQEVAAGFSEEFCDPESNVLETASRQIEAASDIMSDGSQSPGAPCDAISIGIGFEASKVILGEVAPAAPPAPDPCAEGGGGAGGGESGGGGNGGSGG